MKNLLLILILCLPAALCTAQAGQWQELNTKGQEFDTGEITSVYCQPQGTIYIGTEFKAVIANENSYGKLFQWDSSALSRQTFFPSYKKEMAIRQIIGDAEGSVYVSGYYKIKSHSQRAYIVYDIPFIYKWDGEVWKQVFTGNPKRQENAYVEAMCVDASGNLYAIGTAFMKDKHRYIAMWKDDKWSEVGQDKLTLRAEKHGPLVLCTDGEGNLYAGGNFAGHAKGNVFKWDGNGWEALGHESNALNADKDIRAIVIDHNQNIYIACAFVSGSKKQYVARWDGKLWSEVGYGTSFLDANNDICALFVDAKGILYAAGRFVNANGNKYVAKWDGKQWLELGGDNSLQANGDILSLSMDSMGRLYACGRFKNANGKHYVAVFVP